MNYPNLIQFELSGRYALFTDPLMLCGGEKSSLPVPTREALKGAARGIYSSREFCWSIDAVRIMNPIKTEAVTLTRLNYFEKGSDISVYTYLRDVRYKVLAHLEFPEDTPPDIQHKCYSIARRMLKKGGRRQVYLGTKSCPAALSPCRFHDESGYYDEHSAYYGLMHHSFLYQNGCVISQRLFHCSMEHGIITFPPPNQCPVSRTVQSHALV